MNKSEVAKLLTLVSTFDSRTVGIDTVEAWHTILADVDLQDAVTAVRNHFATSTDYMMPAHIVTASRRLAKRPKLVSDASLYCNVHWLPKRACERCGEVSGV